MAFLRRRALADFNAIRCIWALRAYSESPLRPSTGAEVVQIWRHPRPQTGTRRQTTAEQLAGAAVSQ